MIIPKVTRLTAEQEARITRILEAHDCRPILLRGAHRDIVAIIGDERSDTMMHRLLGLDFVERVDRMEAIYKLMDIHSDLAAHTFTAGGVELGKEPLFIAGHCTIDPKEPGLFLETAHAVKEAGAHVLRGGVWKPRTSPHAYQGAAKTLEILLQARQETGLPVIAEVMDESQLQLALEAHCDMLQIGTRNALNYPLLAAIGRSTHESGTPVLLKRGRHMGPVDEFIAAAEYIVSQGNPNVILCPRGTLPALDGYRNHPDECITPLLKEKTWAPVVVDPSHAVGRAQYVPASALSALAYGADGVILETHIDSVRGIGDDPRQSIHPSTLRTLIEDGRTVWNLASRFRKRREPLA